MSIVQGGLPADPYNPARPPMNISLNNPPCVPQFQAPGFMNDLIPVIAAAVAIDFQSNARSSPPRMFAYNLVSESGYQNPIFAGIVMGIVDWVCLSLADQKFRSPEQAAEALVPKMCEIFVANQVMQYAELQQNVPPPMQSHITGLISMYQAVANEIGAFKQSPVYASMMNPQQQGFGGGNQGGGWQQGGGNQQWGQPQAQQWGGGNNSSFGGGNKWGGGSNQGGGWMAQRPQAQRQFAGGLNASGGSSGLFSGSSNVGAPAAEQSSFNTSRFETRMAEEHPVKKSAWVAPTEAAVDVVAKQVETKPEGNEPEHADSSKLVWRASVRQPYALAYNPRTHLLYLQKLPDGTVIQLVKERTESSMEREKHRLPTAFGPAPKHIDTTKSVDSLHRVSAGIKLLTEVTGDGEAGDEPPKKPLVQVVEEAWVLEPSENLAWLQGTLKQMAVMQDLDTPDVFRIRAQVAEPFVSAKDERGAIESFAEAKSYTELQEMMRSVEAALSGSLFAAIDRKMTDVVNRVLSQSLSIGDIRIQSFVADVADLPPVIRKYYGETFENAFLGNQVKFIRAAFAKFAEAEDEDLLTDNLLMDRVYSENNGPKISYLVSNFTLTYLNVTAVELELELDPKDKIASMITSDMPELRSLAESIFESTSGDVDNFFRHLVRTTDDHVLEITEGLIGSEIYLVRKVR
jgi:hypothetical protein